MKIIVRAVVATAVTLSMAGCSVTPVCSMIGSTPDKVYLLIDDGVTIGVYLSQEAANDKEFSFSTNDQKHLSVMAMEIDG